MTGSGKHDASHDLRGMLMARIKAIYPQVKDSAELLGKLEGASDEELAEYLELAELTARHARDSARVGTAAFLAGVSGADGQVLPADILDSHDWRRFLLARQMDADFTGPDWVPFNLMSIHDGCGDGPLRSIAQTLIFNAGARDLWGAIEASYDRPNNIASALPLELCGIFEHWEKLNKATPSEHKTHMLRLKSHSLALAAEIDRIDALGEMLTGERLDFMQLYSEEERNAVFTCVRMHNFRMRRRVEEATARQQAGSGSGAAFTCADWESYNAPINDPSMAESPINHSVAGLESHETWRLILGDEDGCQGVVPPMPDMLRRLAAYFDKEAREPALQRPAHSNAKRNFVARRLCEFFKTSCGQASPTIISRIVCMFFEQGITDNEVSQMLRRPAPSP